MTQTQPETAAARIRQYSWSDPSATVRVIGGLPGIDVLHAIAAGELPGPPIAATLGFEIETIEPGRVVFTLQPDEMHYNPLGSVHGGVIATLLDSAAGCAVQSLLDRGSGYTSVDLHTRFLRPVTMTTGRIRAVGSVLSRGSRTALAVAQLLDDADRLLAHATSTCLIFEVTSPTGATATGASS
jgi:uncharacterized protein (TIGR00369 family)